MPELVKSAAEQEQAAKQQRAAKASTYLQLASQYVSAAVTGYKGELPIYDALDPEQVAEFGLRTARELMSGWEKTAGLED